MSEPFRILVTGVGALIGYGAIRSLRASRFPVHIIGMDIYPDAVGQVWSDTFVQAIPAAHPDYPDFLLDLIEREHVDLVLPAIEQDIARIVEDEDRLRQGRAKLALNNRILIRLAQDKWAMHQKLLHLGFAVIPTTIAGEFEEIADLFGVPFLLKPRHGYASKGIVHVHKASEFGFWKKSMGDDFMAQQIVGTADRGEFTVGAFGLGDGTACGSIVLERTLSREGATAKAWVRHRPELELLVARLVDLLRPEGPTNFQFREHEGEHLPLEINPRLSSSNSIRTAFGYNEAEMSVEHYLLGKRPVAPVLSEGFAVRYIEDVVRHARDHL